jgi:hypothetical protein
MSSIYSGGASLAETLQQGMGGFGVDLSGGPVTVPSLFAADSFTVHNLSEHFVRITLQLAGGIGGVVNNPTVVAPGAVYSVAFAERNIVGGVQLEAVAFPGGGGVHPAAAFTPVGAATGYCLVDFVET